MSLVIDNSVVLAWCLVDEDSAVAEAAMETVNEQGAVVPGIWWYELRNALVVNERRGRLTAEDTHATLADLGDMSIAIDRDHDERAMLEIARQCGLSIYDAAYLEVAQRRRVPITTLDDRLRQAAERLGVPLFTGI